MTPPSAPIFREALGTIIGVSRAQLVIVRLDDGAEVPCRGLRRLHRPLGFMGIPVGRRARVRFDDAKPNRPPLLLEVLPAEPPNPSD
jgi:hypothetical protein